MDGVLKNNIVEFDEKIFKQNVEPQEEQSLHLLMLFFFMRYFEEKMLESFGGEKTKDFVEVYR